MGTCAPIGHFPHRELSGEKFFLIFAILQHAAIHCTIEQQTKTTSKTAAINFFLQLTAEIN